MIIPDVDLEEEMACIAHISARLPDGVAGPDLPSHPEGLGLASLEVDPPHDDGISCIWNTRFC